MALPRDELAELLFPEYREPDLGPFYPAAGMDLEDVPVFNPGKTFMPREQAGGSFANQIAPALAQTPRPGLRGPTGDVFAAHLLSGAARGYGQSQMRETERREASQAALDRERLEMNRRTAMATEAQIRDRIARRKESAGEARTLAREERAEARALGREERTEERAKAREERAADRRRDPQDMRAYRISKEMATRLNDENFPVGKPVTFSEYEALRKRAYPEPGKPATAHETMREVTASEDLKATVLRRIKAARDAGELQEAINLIPQGSSLERDREVREQFQKRSDRTRGRKR